MPGGSSPTRPARWGAGHGAWKGGEKKNDDDHEQQDHHHQQREEEEEEEKEGEKGEEDRRGLEGELRQARLDLAHRDDVILGHERWHAWNAWTVPQIRAYCRAAGLEVASGARKGDLVQMLVRRIGDPPPAGPEE